MSASSSAGGVVPPDMRGWSRGSRRNAGTAKPRQEQSDGSSKTQLFADNVS